METRVIVMLSCLIRNAKNWLQIIGHHPLSVNKTFRALLNNILPAMIRAMTLTICRLPFSYLGYADFFSNLINLNNIIK
jgi:hypothetical protein